MAVVVHVDVLHDIENSPEVAALVKRMVDAGAEAARRYVPVDTGNLKGSITSEADGTTGRYGSEVEYAGYVEFGTSKMAAQPYLRPAIDAMAQAAR